MLWLSLSWPSVELVSLWHFDTKSETFHFASLKIQCSGHFVEAQILEALEIDFIDESEVLTMADEENHINKHNFKVPFVCGFVLENHPFNIFVT
jgi:hypothetical protein